MLEVSESLADNVRDRFGVGSVVTCRDDLTPPSAIDINSTKVVSDHPVGQP